MFIGSRISRNTAIISWPTAVGGGGGGWAGWDGTVFGTGGGGSREWSAGTVLKMDAPGDAELGLGLRGTRLTAAGPGLSLSVPQITNIVYNEAISLHGPSDRLQKMYQDIAYAILNGYRLFGNGRPGTAPDYLKMPIASQTEANIYNAMQVAVQSAVTNMNNGIVPINGDYYYGFRDPSYTNLLMPRNYVEIPDVFVGPFANSSPSSTQLLGPTNNYLVIFSPPWP